MTKKDENAAIVLKKLISQGKRSRQEHFSLVVLNDSLYSFI